MLRSGPGLQRNDPAEPNISWVPRLDLGHTESRRNPARNRGQVLRNWLYV